MLLKRGRKAGVLQFCKMAQKLIFIIATNNEKIRSEVRKYLKLIAAFKDEIRDIIFLEALKDYKIKIENEQK